MLIGFSRWIVTLPPRRFMFVSIVPKSLRMGNLLLVAYFIPFIFGVALQMWLPAKRSTSLSVLSMATTKSGERLWSQSPTRLGNSCRRILFWGIINMSSWKYIRRVIKGSFSPLWIETFETSESWPRIWLKAWILHESFNANLQRNNTMYYNKGNSITYFSIFYPAWIVCTVATTNRSCKIPM